MGTRDIVLLQSKYAENSQTTQTLLNQAGSRVTITKFTASNVTAGTVTLAVSIVASGGTVSTDELVLPARSIAAGEVYNCPELIGHVLMTGDFISLVASAASSIVIRAGGREVT